MAPGADWMNVFEGESFLLRPTAHEQGVITDLLQAMQEEQKMGLRWSTEYTRMLLLQLLITLERIRRAKPALVSPEQSEGQRRVYSIIEYLDNHYSERLSLGGGSCRAVLHKRNISVPDFQADDRLHHHRIP
ncbi:hypothetical protein ACFTAO_49535 [Paenibacillus rhizoplanae]